MNAADTGDVVPSSGEHEGGVVASPNEYTAADDASAETPATTGFQVRLPNFEGPFDLLLNLISQHRLDVTEVALHEVTDDFIAYTREMGAELPLEQTTEFLVVAATLLDLKAARLLPTGEVDDPEDLALLEARDLLFARLLQYRAYKQVAALFGELEAAALQRYPRAVSLEQQFEDLLPEVTLGVDAHGFVEVAASALTPRPVPTVGLDHLHDVHKVSVPAQAKRMAGLLSAVPGQWLSFTDLVADCANGLEVVGSFLGLLELYRQRAITFDQPEALGDLRVTWTGDRDADDVNIDKAEDYG
ncbi:chromosome segregation and condensation protein ScpA [Gordonia bronchialis DSM 43247]|uniref:Segregation and condensation protein A n=1 Tax=Gordonia bronchialis (strain ATCC 25592 / DSM 43247 / BCRC 13721 / JCM 3198 / KCTC 3076 / NBRC 16047 / NCTC 10667) TaxID=526226 RepID=D0L942_GORB4|nr:segregation/condensation protein A [Gordonia bronchialis]ACY22033.1 chromosome segregation and condensation protein ScpA [Gordonia bronchialis DSM 43247]MCC3324825.1 segregation/condensation protein A [Gordonia bronchialis]QGS24399.1 segregation/condensation protein A [Gordonia bronchialis]STQ64948.1 Segregation and condensation protein A [Gordonia bronchialis]